MNRPLDASAEEWAEFNAVCRLVDRVRAGRRGPAAWETWASLPVARTGVFENNPIYSLGRISRPRDAA